MTNVNTDIKSWFESNPCVMGSIYVLPKTKDRMLKDSDEMFAMKIIYHKEVLFVRVGSGDAVVVQTLGLDESKLFFTKGRWPNKGDFHINLNIFVSKEKNHTFLNQNCSKSGLSIFHDRA